MIQRFIELGEGYSDIYELIELVDTNKDRLETLLRLNTTIEKRKVTSLVAIFSPASDGHFQPLYICREGIPNPDVKPNQRYALFEQTAARLNEDIVSLNVQPSVLYTEKSLYYQHLIGILRTNKILPPLK